MAGDASRAIEVLRHAMRAKGGADPPSLAALAKDASVLVKLLRNPAEKPEEAKFRSIKLGNAAIARVLAHPGAREMFEASGFAPTAELLELGHLDPPGIARLQRSAEGVEAVQHMLQELNWLHAARAEAVSLSARPWSADTAAKLLVQSCLASLAGHAPDAADAGKAKWVQILHTILATPWLHECREVLRQQMGFAVSVVRGVALELIAEGGHDLQALVQANKCFALLLPPGDARTLDDRVDFCFACLEAALPADDELMALELKLAKDDLLGSTIEALSSFSDMVSAAPNSHVHRRCHARLTFPLARVEAGPRARSDAGTPHFRRRACGAAS